MTRQEAISHIAATEMQCIEEYASTDAQRQYAMDECYTALRALGVTEEEIKQYA